MERLKPCPFCGAVAKITRIRGSERPYVAVCQKEECQASVGVYSYTRAEAAKVWNRRVKVDQSVDPSKKLNNQLKY